MQKRHVIVGGGMCGHAAAAALRAADPAAKITLLAAEPEPPYARPPLSKGLWFGRSEESIRLRDVPALDLRLGRRAVALDPAARLVRDDAGETHPFDACLLATGGAPRRLPFGGDRIVYFRTLADYRRLRAVEGRRVAVIGGGFIGSEVAAALASNGKDVTMIFPEEAIGARAYPRELAAAVSRMYGEKGVRVLAGDTVAALEADGNGSRLRTARGEQLHADAVVAGLGIAPDTALAAAAGLRCQDGIVVDERLETSAPGVYAAGDVARFPSAALGEAVRVEHEDAALSMGEVAARNMAGAQEPYRHLPFFYSDLFELGYEAVGRLDARLETVASWEEPFRKGVVYYLDAGRVAGVLLWGIFGQVDAARELIERRAPVSREALADAIAP